MKGFIGTKIVLALAMTRLAYNQYRGWELPANENGDDAGYLVEYTDGGKPNMEGHAGYVSWSPKEQFDNAYIDIGEISGLTPERVALLGERAQLAARSLDLGAQLVTAESAAPNTGNEYLDNLAHRLTAQLGRHKNTLDDAIYVIDQRLQLMQIQADVEASLQAQQPVE